MIRKTKIQDIADIESLIKSENGLWNKNWRKDVLNLAIKSSADLTYVFVEDNKIVGFICAHDLGFRGYLSELIVDSEYRKQGVGKKLVKKVEQVLKRGGCKTLVSDVWKSSKKFYETLGWSKPDVVLIRKKL